MSECQNVKCQNVSRTNRRFPCLDRPECVEDVLEALRVKRTCNNALLESHLLSDHLND